MRLARGLPYLLHAPLLRADAPSQGAEMAPGRLPCGALGFFFNFLFPAPLGAFQRHAAFLFSRLILIDLFHPPLSSLARFCRPGAAVADGSLAKRCVPEADAANSAAAAVGRR